MTPTALNLPSDQDISGRDFGRRERELLEEVLASGTLTCTKGTMVRRFEQAFAKRYDVPHAVANASGTAAVHCALGACGVGPGEEVITTPITDMGAITPILFQGATPVFADVDPLTLNLTAESIEAALTERTRAVIVTHLFGNPVVMDPILELVKRRGLFLIEDTAQAYLATWKGKLVGSLGDIGCFSMQQGKHICTGEGGLCITADESLRRKIKLFVDKAWGYGDPKSDHYFPALNYRITELQGAVALAQLEKLEEVVRRRQESFGKFAALMADLEQVGLPVVHPEATCSWWKVAIRIEQPGTLDRLAEALRRSGVPAAPRYIQKPAFDCQVLRDWYAQRGLGLRAGVDYQDRAEAYPGAYSGLSRVMVLAWNEFYTDAHVESIAAAIKEAV